MNVEQAPKTENAESDPPKLRGLLPPTGKRAMRAPVGSAGVVSAAREALAVVRTHQPEPREGRPGRQGGGGKELWFENDLERRQGMATGERLAGPEKVRQLQTVLHGY